VIPLNNVDLVTAASYYAVELGWVVFPLQERSKVPYTGSHGFEDGRSEPAWVAEQWQRHPRSNIGVRTGSRSSGGSGFDVVDIDSPEGLRALHDRAGGLRVAWGPTSRTGGGWHLLAAAGDRTNRTRFAVGCDLKANDAYVVLPPSIHPGGHRYRWISPPDTELRPTSPWLEQLLSPRTVRQLVPADGVVSSTMASQALRLAVVAVADAAAGSRNDTLNAQAFKLRPLVVAGSLDEGRVLRALCDAAGVCGLSEREAFATVCSGLGISRRSP
jgi:hypothetical protein